MTLAQFCKAVRQANPGVTVRWIPETREFRVAYRELPNEDSAYYTNDRDDCAATAKAMWDARYLKGQL